jgi:putative ABC transport system substrate-binding protein
VAARVHHAARRSGGGAAQDALVSEFRDALREIGHVEGQTLAITYRWADGRLELLPSLVAELVAGNVDVIIALGPAAWAAKHTTSTVPIVIAFSGDPPRGHSRRQVKGERPS